MEENHAEEEVDARGSAGDASGVIDLAAPFDLCADRGIDSDVKCEDLPNSRDDGEPEWTWKVSRDCSLPVVVGHADADRCLGSDEAGRLTWSEAPGGCASPLSPCSPLVPTYLPWSLSLAAAVQKDQDVGLNSLSPETLRMLTGARPVVVCPSVHDMEGDEWQHPTDTQDEDRELAAALAEISGCPRPVEALVLSMAFSHLLRRGAGRREEVGAIDSRHQDVEELLLKYTCLESRRALRAELDAWRPSADTAQDVAEKPRWLQQLEEDGRGPDDTGAALSFEVFVAFIVAHASPRRLLQLAFERHLAAALGGTAADDSQEERPRPQLHRAVEESLAPLLAGELLATVACGGDLLDESAGDYNFEAGANAAESARFARGVAAHAAGLAAASVQGGAGAAAAGPLDMAGFLVAYDRAAALARIIVAHLTGDLRRWRGSAPLRHSIGGA